tara:strand:- start:609 stop:791 length:183 start_codon:yes stop_codon:yes gene_type:complete
VLSVSTKSTLLPAATAALIKARESVVFPLPPFRAIAAITTRLSFGILASFIKNSEKKQKC